MARYNEILVGRFNRALQKAFSMKGEPPAPQLASEIAPAIQMSWGTEMQYLEGWGSFAVAAGIAAGGAGTRAAFRIDNPKSNTIVAVIEKLVITSLSGAADQPLLTYSIVSGGDFASSMITTNTGLDNRGPQSPQLHITARNDVNAVAGVTIYQGSLIAAGTLELILDEHMELPVLPNSSYTVYSNVLNQAINGTIWWRERFLEDSERS